MESRRGLLGVAVLPPSPVPLAEGVVSVLGPRAGRAVGEVKASASDGTGHDAEENLFHHIPSAQVSSSIRLLIPTSFQAIKHRVCRVSYCRSVGVSRNR